MTPEAQRIAIAEACGITVEPCTCAGGLVKRDAKTKKHLPDYLTDLNAMAEAEKAVLFKDVSLYLKNAGNLENVCGGNLDALYATAAQRAQAFLKTTGKWEDGK